MIGDWNATPLVDKEQGASGEGEMLTATYKWCFLNKVLWF